MGDENLRRLAELEKAYVERGLSYMGQRKLLEVAHKLAAEAREMADKNFRNYEGRLKAEARVKELVERRNRLIQEKYEAEARSERMREVGEELARHHEYMNKHENLMCSKDCRFVAEWDALDTDTTAGNVAHVPGEGPVSETTSNARDLENLNRGTTAGEQG